MKKALIILLSVAGLILLSVLWLFSQIYTTSKLDLAQKADAIAVLGAAEYAGKPSPVFQARLDHAFDLFKNDFAPIIITTGGTHPGENYSEGEVGKKYLEKKGVPPEKVFAETDSLTTKQNITRVRQIIQEKNLSRIILVSDPFHMYRAVEIAKDLGIESFPSPTATSPISKNFFLELKFMGREILLTMLHKLFDA